MFCNTGEAFLEDLSYSKFIHHVLEQEEGRDFSCMVEHRCCNKIHSLAISHRGVDVCESQQNTFKSCMCVFSDKEWIWKERPLDIALYLFLIIAWPILLHDPVISRNARFLVKLVFVSVFQPFVCMHTKIETQQRCRFILHSLAFASSNQRCEAQTSEDFFSDTLMLFRLFFIRRHRLVWFVPLTGFLCRGSIGCQML